MVSSHGAQSQHTTIGSKHYNQETLAWHRVAVGTYERDRAEWEEMANAYLGEKHIVYKSAYHSLVHGNEYAWVVAGRCVCKVANAGL